MSRRKDEPVIQAMAMYDSLSDEDKKLLAAYIRYKSRQPQKREKNTKRPLCGVCGNFEEWAGHDLTYSSSHAFEDVKKHPFAGPGTAQPVRRRSSRKKEADGSIASIDKGNAGIVLPDNPDDFKVA